MGFDKAFGEEGKSTFQQKVEQVAKTEAKAETVDRLSDILEKLVASSTEKGISAEQLETLLTRAGMTSAEAMRLSLKPENPDPTHISAFFTKDDMLKYGSFENKPKLRIKTYFCGIEEKDDRLTPAEIEAYNALEGFQEARNGVWKAEVKRNGRHEELHVNLPIDTIDSRMGLPPLLLILMELAGGPSTADIHNLLKQIENLKGLAVKSGASVKDLEAAMLGAS